jgi:alpha-D-ribose 1-methylphosphonate 5-triphosphate synthase subunit PhnH
MKIDMVHDIHSVFRKIVKALSFPGEILNLKDEADKIDLDLPVSKNIMVLSMALFDREITFYCDNNDATDSIAKLTYGHKSELNTSDFVILTNLNDVETQITSLRRGTLMDPHLGATLILELQDLVDGSETYVLTGPGIKESNVFRTSGLKEIVKAREVVNGEFPLGIDLLLVDKKGNLLALPRTTKIEGEN